MSTAATFTALTEARSIVLFLPAQPRQPASPAADEAEPAEATREAETQTLPAAASR